MNEQNHTVIEWMPSFSVFNEPEKEKSMEDKVDQYLPYVSLPSRDEQEPEHSSTWKKVMEENPLRWMPSFSAFDDSNKLQSEVPGPMENQAITWNPSFSVFNNHSVSDLEELRNAEGVLRHPSAYLSTNTLQLNRAREVSVIDNTEESCIEMTASDEEMDIQVISQMQKESPLGDKQTKRQRDCCFAITETVEGHEISFAQLYYGVEYDQKKAIKEYVCQNMTLDTQNSAEVHESIEGDKAIGDREKASCGIRYRIIFMIFGIMVILLAVIIGALEGVRRNPMSVQQNPTHITKNNTASTPISTENSSKHQGNGEIEGSNSSPTINDHLLKILSPISSSKLENEDSPQSIAALSLSKEVEKYNSQYLSSNQDAIIQRFVLLILVFSLSNEKPTWIELNECSWNFTTCTSEGIIESLKMVNMNLSGKIPHEISYLSYLTTLDMSSNNLKGSLPDDLFSMRSLKHLYLDKNQLTGSLSPSIGSMTKLESLFLGENEFTGLIPETLPSSLRYISLYKNKFDGMIPRLFLKSNNRFYVDLSQNELAGTLPEDSISSNLRHLYLSHNHINGSIPSLFASLNIESLFLDNNRLTGGFPPHFGENFLSTLHLQGNDFSDVKFKEKICILDIFQQGVLIELSADCSICNCDGRLCSSCYKPS